MLKHSRLINLFGFLLTLGLLIIAMLLQIYKHLEPCPLCIFQRLAFTLIAGWFFFFMLLPQSKGWQLTHGVLQLLVAAVGIFIAGWQIHLQYFAAQEAVSCGPGLQVIFANANLPDALAFVLKSGGSCHVIDWRLFGLSMAVWSALGFLFFIAWAILLIVIAKSRR